MLRKPFGHQLRGFTSQVELFGRNSLSERGEIKRDGAKAQKNSGRGQIQKGDAILGPFLVDYKEYEKGFRITPEIWAKLCGDAFRSGRLVPALKLILGAGKLRLWVVEDDIIRHYLELKEKYGE